MSQIFHSKTNFTLPLSQIKSAKLRVQSFKFDTFKDTVISTYPTKLVCISWNLVHWLSPKEESLTKTMLPVGKINLPSTCLFYTQGFDIKSSKWSQCIVELSAYIWQHLNSKREGGKKGTHMIWNKNLNWPSFSKKPHLQKNQYTPKNSIR